MTGDSVVNPNLTNIKETSAEGDAAARTKTTSGAELARFAEDRGKIEELLQVNIEPQSKADVSASTVVKMMGLATSSELKLIEGKLDLLSGRLGNFNIRLERVMTQLNNLPSANDFERLEAHFSSLRSLLKDATSQTKSVASEEGVTKEKLQAFINKDEASANTSTVIDSSGIPKVESK
ncbi:MAG: hypothetical protein SGJ02_00835 [bacterium]|nr:hypothetical protein [bacterium]